MSILDRQSPEAIVGDRNRQRERDGPTPIALVPEEHQAAQRGTEVGAEPLTPAVALMGAEPPQPDESVAVSDDPPESVDAAAEDRPPHACPPTIRVIGFPGRFTTWGLDLVRRVLELGGLRAEILPLVQTPSLGAVLGDDAGAVVRVLVTYGPILGHADILPGAGSRTIVFLDDPARALDELLVGGGEPRDAARYLTATLAPLASVVREPGVLLVRRMAGMEAVSVLQAIAAHLMPSLPPPAVTAANDSTGDIAETAPQPSDVVHDITRQVLTPLIDFVTGAARVPMLWPLSCFWGGDRPGEPTPPIVDLLGPRRPIYYGPYFCVPRGRWRVDVQLFFSDDVRDTTFAVDAVAGMELVELVKVRMRPSGGGLFLASFPVIIEQPEEPIQIRVWLDRGAIEGQLGLRQVALHPVEDGDS